MNIAGMEVVANPYVPEFKTKWEYPKHRFVEYEKSDEPWLRYFGFMREIQTTEPVIYQFDGKLIAHPANVVRIRNAIAQTLYSNAASTGAFVNGRNRR